jgi:hypothetical protein
MMSIEWKIKTPMNALHSNDEYVSDWLQEVIGLRQKIFGSPAHISATVINSVAIDSLDLDSYHILAYQSGKCIGYARLTPSASAKKLSNYVLSLGINESIFNPYPKFSLGSGLFVDEGHRSLALVLGLIARTYAASLELGVEKLIAFAGTKLGQDRIMMRTGAVQIPGSKLSYSSRFNDSIRQLEINPAATKATFQAKMAEIQEKMAGEISRLSSKSLKREHFTYMGHD